jgi:tripartite ATP-independent transporter DctM subunit
MTLLLLLSAVVVLMLLRVPIAIALALPSGVYIWDQSLGLEVVSQRLIAGVDSFPLIAVPLFMLAGGLMNAGGITERIYRFVAAVLGHIRGSHGYVNVAGSVIFSGMSGAAVVDAAGLGAIEIKAMREHGYSDKFAIGITAASSTIGPIIPPSIPAVVYSVASGVSLGGLFIAGIIPGLVMALMLCVAIFVYTRFNHISTTEKQPFGVMVSTFIEALPALLTPVVILAGMFLGFFTPTEAGAIAVLYAIGVSLLVYRGTNFRGLVKLLLETAEMTAAILIIVAASAVFGWILALEQAPQMMMEAVLSLTDNKYVFLLLVIGILLAVGTVLEPITAIMIVVPVLTPLVKVFAVDPIQFGIVVILTLMIGLLTPPVGLVLFVLHSVSGVPMKTAIRGAMPFLIPLFAALLLVAFIPQISLVLPRALGY